MDKQPEPIITFRKGEFGPFVERQWIFGGLGGLTLGTTLGRLEHGDMAILGILVALLANLLLRHRQPPQV